MQTKTYHISNLGSYGAGIPTDHHGYVTIHDSPRYAEADDAQLSEWAESRTRTVRAAALTEMAERSLSKWRRGEGR